MAYLHEQHNVTRDKLSFKKPSQIIAQSRVSIQVYLAVVDTRQPRILSFEPIEIRCYGYRQSAAAICFLPLGVPKLQVQLADVVWIRRSCHKQKVTACSEPSSAAIST